MVGQAGVEHAYNKLLMGVDGDRYVVVNSVGREIARRSVTARPAEGRRAAADHRRRRAEGDRGRLPRERASTAPRSILDPRNGEVLSLISLPAYDPNAFSRRHRSRDLGGAQHRPAEAAAEPRAPGPLLAGIDVQDGGGDRRRSKEGVITPEFRVHCSGGASFYGRYFQCWKKGGHGTVDLRHAIEQSCNVYFYTVGNMLGVDRIHKWATALGLGEKTGIDLPNEVQGLVPSTEWKRQRVNEEVVPRRDDLGLDRPGAGVGDADVAGGHDDDGRQRRHARHAAPRQGGGRRQGLEAGAAAAAARMSYR